MKTKFTANREKLAYSVGEISKQTSLSIPFLRTEIRAGNLKAKRFGSRVLILSQDLQAYLLKQKV